MPGHLFAFQCDLTRLACDAVVLPCDAHGNIGYWWTKLLPDELGRGDTSEWLRLPEERRAGTVFTLPPTDGRHVFAAVTTERNLDIPEMVNRVVAAISVASRDLAASDGRDLPLVALPLVGTGDGGLHGRRGEVVEALLPALRDVAEGASVDIALVLGERRDVAAVQARRTADDWHALPAHLAESADRLGRLAAEGQLSLFLGAGLSRPVGLPDWWGLLRLLAEAAGLPATWPVDQDVLDAATPIVDELKSQGRYDELMRGFLDSDRHGIGHGILAGLGVHQVVTTNFDPCMELALDAVVGQHEYRVLTRQIASGGKPWLLKIHGDIRRPGSMVMTTADYQRHEMAGQALHGVVHSLMLTSHLLFVGFSMIDANFLKMAAAVSRVRELADISPDGQARAGTALALTRDAMTTSNLEADLDFQPMQEGGTVASAARVLEIYLDRLAWSAAQARDLAAEYLLDDRYASGLDSADRALRDSLVHLQETVDASAKGSVGWSTFQTAMCRLGWGGESR